MTATQMRAAGGAVWRTVGGTTLVALVHRPRYDDWGLPKGKADPGEDDLTCALREVSEETALQCDVGQELGSVSYVDRDGRDKVVRYWAMTVVTEQPHVPDDEIDEVRWLPLDEAVHLLTYAQDRPILAALRAHLAAVE